MTEQEKTAATAAETAEKEQSILSGPARPMNYAEAGDMVVHGRIRRETTIKETAADFQRRFGVLVDSLPLSVGDRERVSAAVDTFVDEISKLALANINRTLTDETARMLRQGAQEQLTYGASQVLRVQKEIEKLHSILITAAS